MRGLGGIEGQTKNLTADCFHVLHDIFFEGKNWTGENEV